MNCHQSKIFHWILLRNWRGHNNLNNVISDYLPLFQKKYMHPFDVVDQETVLSDVRKHTRLLPKGIFLEIETNKGFVRFPIIDISASGLSFMIFRDLAFFKKYHTHFLKLKIGDLEFQITGRYRHLTLISSKKPYYKFGLEFETGHEKLLDLLEKLHTKDDE